MHLTAIEKGLPGFNPWLKLMTVKGGGGLNYHRLVMRRSFAMNHRVTWRERDDKEDDGNDAPY